MAPESRLLDAVQKFDTEDKAEAWFVEQRWPSGVIFCGSLNVAIVLASLSPSVAVRRNAASLCQDALLHSSNLPLSKWAIAFFLYSTNLKGVSSMKLHRDLGIAQSSAWYMAHRIREMWTAETEKFTGPVEVDETAGKRPTSTPARNYGPDVDQWAKPPLSG